MTTEQNYLHDLVLLLLQRAREAKRNASHAGTQDGPSAEFETGRLQGYYEALSAILGQLDAFGITRESLGLDRSFDLERELL